MTVTLTDDKDIYLYEATEWHKTTNTTAMIAHYIRRFREAIVNINYLICTHKYPDSKDNTLDRKELIAQITKIYQEKVVDTYFRAQANIWIMREFFQNHTPAHDIERLDTELAGSRSRLMNTTRALGHDFIFTKPRFTYDADKLDNARKQALMRPA